MAADAEINVSVPGVTPISARHALVIRPAAAGEPGPHLILPDDARVLVRSRRPGDRFAPQGLNGHHQTMKKWMIDHQVPQRFRAHVPLLIVDERIAVILYAPPYAISHAFSRETGQEYAVILETI
jgi:tRNA(Ile)-lysidine synthetase-like protein